MKTASNRKGLELAINTVTIMALVLIVLIVVAGFFLGGFGKAGGGVSKYISGAEKEVPAELDIPSYKEVGGTCTGTVSAVDCSSCTSVGTVSGPKCGTSATSNCRKYCDYVATNTCGPKDCSTWDNDKDGCTAAGCTWNPEIVYQ